MLQGTRDGPPFCDLDRPSRIAVQTRPKSLEDASQSSMTTCIIDYSLIPHSCYTLAGDFLYMS